VALRSPRWAYVALSPLKSSAPGRSPWPCVAPDGNRTQTCPKAWLGVATDVVPHLVVVSDEPPRSMIPFEYDAGVEAARRRLAPKARVSHGPVVSVHQIGQI